MLADPFHFIYLRRHLHHLKKVLQYPENWRFTSLALGMKGDVP